MLTKTTRAIPELSIDSRVIEERLSKLHMGEMVTYAELSELIGRDIRDKRGCLYTAIKRLLHNHIVLACVRGIGVKRLLDGEVVAIGEEVIPRIRKMSRRAIIKVTSIESFDRLSKEHKIQHNAVLSMLGALAQMSTSSNIKKLEKEVEKVAMELPIAKTLELFK